MANLNNNTHNNITNNVLYNAGESAYIDVETSDTLLFGSKLIPGSNQVTNIGSLGNGTIVGARYGLDSFGSHLLFGGNDNVKVPTMQAFADGQNSVCFEAWVSPSYVGQPNNMILGTLLAENCGIRVIGGYPRLTVHTTSAVDVISPNLLSGLTHLIGCYDGSSFMLFQNGVLVASAAGTGEVINSTHFFNIGNYNNLTSVAGFNGKIYTAKASIAVHPDMVGYAKHEYQRGMHFINAA